MGNNVIKWKRWWVRMRFPTFATSLSPLINRGISVDIHPGDPPSKADGPWEPILVAELWRMTRDM